MSDTADAHRGGIHQDTIREEPTTSYSYSVTHSPSGQSSSSSRPPSHMKNEVSGDHRLSSIHRGESEVEQMAERIETLRANRVVITFPVRVRFLTECRQIAVAQGYDSTKISRTDLEVLRSRIAEEASRTPEVWTRALGVLGFYNVAPALLVVLDRAMETLLLHDDDWLHYQDFSFYYTRVVARWPWLRSEMRVACLIIFAYYFFTPILFCHIVQEDTICVDLGRSYDGWLSSLYFASTTLSTVGYGDLKVEQSPRWRSFIGSLYMIVSIVVAVVAFSAAAGNAFSPLNTYDAWIANFFIGDPHPNDFLYTRVARVKLVKITEIVVQFVLLNLIGVFVTRYYARHSEVEEQQWTWMTSLYWAIQTTTTIGYGDLDMPFQLRWFQIFYLTLSTYFVGNCLGKLGALRAELAEVRRRYVWERRKVTRRFIDELQAYEHDDNVDQFEFLVASLLMLNKISSADVTPIMDKFRELAGGKGFINALDDAEEDPIADEAEAVDADIQGQQS
jgi:hypothetical protein